MRQPSPRTIKRVRLLRRLLVATVGLVAILAKIAHDQGWTFGLR